MCVYVPTDRKESAVQREHYLHVILLDGILTLVPPYQEENGILKEVVVVLCYPKKKQCEKINPSIVAQMLFLEGCKKVEEKRQESEKH